ncbi:MAG: polyketide synthase dehydratase domain-containing protein [Burkholderiaceae bacterium]|nr:polyketide synthase dehydratase domain-containing protein [Rhodoferax sp.]MCP5286154.1 polyketide synthase dehydratase domain-containing protein [Burkholderiaceae bacterium]
MSGHGNAPIAIVGMACIFPQAPDLQAFWNNILTGLDAIGEPVESWDAQRYLDSDRIRTPYGGYLKDLYRFDPREFGIMPNSLDGGEPDQFLALRVSRDALADAGYLRPDYDHVDTGVILGHSTYLHRGQGTLVQNNIVIDQTLDLLRAAVPGLDEARVAEVRSLLLRKLPPSSADTVPGLVPNVMTGRIANRLNLRGPNYLVDAACSSSLLAVAAAMDELRAGRSRLMLAGGVNASLPADVSTIFTQLGALSARGKVRPFETGSDGTLLGEGLGVVALKRLDDALADGDRVWGVLRGVGQASDGRATGLLAPSAEGETLAIRRAYEDSGVDPATIGLIEAHGTGIPLGDRTEITSLGNVFGPRQGPQGTIALGSVKSMISHCIPAAGIAGLIKATLALHHRVLPPTLCEQVNPELGLEKTPLFINTETMPWIGRLGQPRRAGVDSFGFGGINTHGVVEQAPPQAKRPPRLEHWPFELVLLSAPTPALLADAVKALLDRLAPDTDAGVAEIAAALARADAGGPARLALVAKDRVTLAKGLETALSRLREGKGGARWSTRTQVHFSAAPMAGDMAFLFPGEGSQFMGMFGDLAQHFDVVREWLDFWHGLYPAAPGDSRTDIVYPPASELTAERRRLLEARLHDMDVGSEAVMIGGQAMHALLRHLGVEPKAMLGHSSGESSALVAAGALPSAPDALAHCIRELNADYRQALERGHIATGALLAVGALPAPQVREVIARHGDALSLAMDNCGNQMVLYGSRAAIDGVQAELTAMGGICMPLPFDRGYHTPAFAAVTETFHAYYKRMKMVAPQGLLYSCCSAAPFPATAAAARKLAAAQWSSTVRFRETILRMHADGVRCFVEVGPSGNLSAFVDDVLADHEHLAIATSQRRRHGLEQLLGALAQLYVNGHWAGGARLFDGRGIASFDLARHVPARPAGLVLDNTMPTIRLDEADRQRLRELLAPAAAVESAQVNTAAAPSAGVPNEVPDGLLPETRVASSTAVLSSAAATNTAPLTLPFIDEVLQQDANGVHVRSLLAVHRDRFLQDHVLSGRVSETDPDLLGLSCVPLMVSLEVMAEAAALLAGHGGIRTIERVRALDWIALDHGEVTLDVQARWVDAAQRRVAVSLFADGQPAVNAEFGLDADWRLPALPALRERRPSRYDGPGLYAAGMFHGPIFQSLVAFDGWDDSGTDARLSPCSLDGFFDEGLSASMVLNPVLLDAMGQLAANWIVDHIGTDFNCFPSTIERVELYRPCPQGEPGLVLRARQVALGGEASDIAAPRRWAFEALDAAGQPLVRVEGLLNVFFPVPNAFYQARRSPLGGWLGQPLALPVATPALVWRLPMLDEAFCAQSAAIFLRMLAHATLSFDERQQWLALEGPLRQRRQWLLGRLCLKEAVRAWVHGRTGTLLYPADVEVAHDAAGAPMVQGWWTEALVAAPSVSLSHDDASCLAAVVEPGHPVGVDLESLARPLRPDLLAASMSPAEQAQWQAAPADHQAEWLLRLWCAKEAAAKLLGTGLQGAPERFVVQLAGVGAATARVQCDGWSVGVVLARDGAHVIAVADRLERGAEVAQ